MKIWNICVLQVTGNEVQAQYVYFEVVIYTIM